MQDDRPTPTEIANLIVNLPKDLREKAVKTHFPTWAFAHAIKSRTITKAQFLQTLRDAPDLPYTGL